MREQLYPAVGAGVEREACDREEILAEARNVVLPGHVDLDGARKLLRGRDAQRDLAAQLEIEPVPHG